MRTTTLLWLLLLQWSTEALLPNSLLPSRRPVADETKHNQQRWSGVSPNNNEEEVETTLPITNQSGMSLALTSAYFTVMAAKCALPSVLSLLASSKTGLTFPSTSTPKALFSKLLLVATFGVAAGKLALGPVIDHFGGMLSLKAALLTLSLALAVISATQSFAVFAVCWVLVDFIFSSCWAAEINAIHQSFDKSSWALQIARLAAAARLGNAAAFAIFASLLSVFEDRLRQPWRPIFAVSALLQLLPVTLLTLFGQHQTPRPTTRRRAWRAPLATLSAAIRTPAFWLHLASRSALMVFASFLLFVPTLMSEVYHASSAAAAQTGSLYAVGCLVAVTAGSKVYARLSKRQRQGLLIGLLSSAIASSLAQLGHMTGAWTLSLGTSTATMFLWGASMAIPFYLPPSLYALARGGPESSATIADVFDIVGFGLLAGFNAHVANLAHAIPSAWIPAFGMTTACAGISLVALVAATEYESNG